MKVAAFYRFLDLKHPKAFRDDLLALCQQQSLLGTILVAAEGFNGTLAGNEGAIANVFTWIEQRASLDKPIEARWTEAEQAPFRRMRMRLKKEIVTLGRPDIRPHTKAGTYVEPAEWNKLIDDPDVLVIDTRNHYEVEVGTFPRAIDPGTDSFRQFPDFAERFASKLGNEMAEIAKDKRIAMFCTGGIRCEKATALMLELGFEDVHHLQGGILNYLQEVPEKQSRWSGECFVFDTRVAVDRDLAEGGYVQCHACRRPLSSEDLQSPDYREGLSCPRCINELDAERAERLEERRKQIALADKRGDKHIGPRG